MRWESRSFLPLPPHRLPHSRSPFRRSISLSLSFDFVLSVSSGSNISTKFVMVPAYAFSFINLYYQSILILNSDVLVSIFLKKLLLQILPISLLLYSSDTWFCDAVSLKLGKISVGSVKLPARNGLDDLLASSDGGKHDYDWSALCTFYIPFNCILLSITHFPQSSLN